MSAMTDTEWQAWNPGMGGYSPFWRFGFTREPGPRSRCVDCGKIGYHDGKVPQPWQLKCLSGDHRGPRQAKLDRGPMGVQPVRPEGSTGEHPRGPRAKR